MANEENLIKNEDLTPEQRRANARKAGIASGIARARRKTMREMLEILLEKEITNNKTGEKVTTQEAMMTAVISKAIKGDMKANEFIRDTVGEKPVERQEVMQIEPPVIVDDVK